jgi:hypothetical protein
MMVMTSDFDASSKAREPMSEEQKIDPRHATTRLVLRTLGPILALIGLLCLIIGTADFFVSSSNFGEPRYFWLNFVGIPVLFVGLVICMMGYLGSYARYVSGEAAPVQKDTFNYLASGTKEGVKTVAGALGEGLASGMNAAGRSVQCPRCHGSNDNDARFCKHCAAPLAR